MLACLLLLFAQTDWTAETAPYFPTRADLKEFAARLDRGLLSKEGLERAELAFRHYHNFSALVRVVETPDLRTAWDAAFRKVHGRAPTAEDLLCCQATAEMLVDPGKYEARLRLMKDAPRRRCSGVVVEKHNGRPIADAVVSNWEQADFVRTGADGKFAGEFRIRFAHPRRLPLLARAEGFGLQGQDRHLANGPWDDFRIELEPEQPQRVRLVDEAGKPLAGARVYHQCLPQPGDIPLQAVANADGVAELFHVRNGHIGGWASAGPEHEAPDFTLRTGEELRTVVVKKRSPPPALLRGLVLGDDGKPAHSARVSTAKRATDGRWQRHEAWTDARGRFAVGVASRTGFELSVEHWRWAHVERKVATDAEVTIHLDRGGAVEGHVRDADGQPAAHAVVDSQGRTAVADAAGHWRLEALPRDAEAPARAEHPFTQQQAKFALTPGQRGVAVRLEPAEDP